MRENQRRFIYPAGAAPERARRALAELDDSVSDTLQAAASGDTEAARALAIRVSSSAAVLALAVDDCVRSEVDQAIAISNAIEGMRRKTIWWGEGFDEASIALAALAAALSVRAVRAHTRLLHAHGELLERRADELEQFAGRIAHDLRNPLAVMELALTALERRRGPEGTAVRALEAGRRATDQMTQLIDGLLAFARAGARPEAGATADLRGVVNDVLATFRSRAEEVAADVVVGVLPAVRVCCSTGALTSALSNLVGNALKYASLGARCRVEVRAQTVGCDVLVTVADNGPGLAPGLDPRTIFEPYVRGRGKEAGIGLGLATVKRVVEGHGGRVGVRSSPAGCTFWFVLPCAPQA
jgi:signal transduction histidine kinase